MSFQLSGVDEMKARLSAERTRYLDAAGKALYAEAQEIRTDSIRRTPVDTGRLRATCAVSLPDISGDDVSCSISYDTDYAVFVHERTELKHTTGEAKFLENALNDAQQGYTGRLADRIKSFLGGA